MEVYITIKFNNEEKFVEAPSSFEELNTKFRQKFEQPEKIKIILFHTKQKIIKR